MARRIKSGNGKRNAAYRKQQQVYRKQRRNRVVLVSSIAVIMIAAIAVLIFKGGPENAFKGKYAPVYNPDASTAIQPKYGEDDIVIIVDAGHGGFDHGTRGSTTGALEKDVNLAIAKYLKLELENRGYVVVMTRENDNALGDSKEADMIKRDSILAGDYIDFTVSIHQNFYEASTDISGPQVFFHIGDVQGEKLAKCIQTKMNRDLDIPSPRSVSSKDTNRLLKNSPKPAVIVECGFFSNQREEKLLTTENYQRQIAKTIADGVDDYIEQEGIR